MVKLVNQFLACVFDGHGPNGGLASNFCRDIWPTLTLAEIGHDSDITALLNESSGAGSEHSASQLVQSLEASCSRMNEVLADSPIDCCVWHNINCNTTCWQAGMVDKCR